jgi:uncharacterized protein (DUF2235 family)
MSRNLIICCDGTNNQFDGDHTNVIRTYKVSQRNERQISFYDPGVGTMPEPWWTTRIGKRWSMIKGLAFGSGFLENIEKAYRFLMANYRPEDSVFLFGFSRGAYTARALAGLLHSIGLLHPDTENLIRYGLRYWQKNFGPDSTGGKLCEEFKTTLARNCPVHFIGVWDTVGSVGFINNFRTFPFTYRNPGVANIRHAVSIDERRACFRQNLMAPATEQQDVKNVWFAGVHSDVGGGYPAKEAGLAKLAFEWMMREARQCGMQIDDTAYERELRHVGSPPNASGPLHVSLQGGWWIVELIPDRRYSFADRKRHWHVFEFNKPRNVLRNAGDPWVYLHRSAIERLCQSGDYRPVNIPHDEATLRKTFQIEN